MKILFTWHAAVEPEYCKLFRELAALGHELTVITPDRWFEGGRLQSADVSGADGYTHITLPVVFRNRIKGFFYPGFRRLAKVFDRLKPDIVHIFEEPYSISALQFTRLAASRSPEARIVVQSFENLVTEQRGAFSYAEKYVLKRADLILAIPEEGIPVWRSKGYNGPIVNVPVGLDPDLFKRSGPDGGSSERAGKVRIAYVGRLAPEKGIDHLLNACAALKQSSASELVILGGGVEKARLLETADRLGISGDVVFMDPVEAVGLPALYSTFDILVLPSLTTDWWKEQFGRVLVEAMACGVVVVGSSSGEIPNVIGDAGFVFKEGDVAGLTEVLKKLVDDVELRASYAARARERVLREFTWTRVSEKLVDAYEKLLK